MHFICCLVCIFLHRPFHFYVKVTLRPYPLHKHCTYVFGSPYLKYYTHKLRSLRWYLQMVAKLKVATSTYTFVICRIMGRFSDVHIVSSMATR